MPLAHVAHVCVTAAATAGFHRGCHRRGLAFSEDGVAAVGGTVGGDASGGAATSAGARAHRGGRSSALLLHGPHLPRWILC